MKKNVICAVSAVMTLAMAGGVTVLAEQKIFRDNKTDTVKQDDASSGSSEAVTAPEIDNSILSGLITDASVDKQETVYVIAKADGGVEKVIVSELLKNNDKAYKINDKSELKNIVNTKNDAKLTMQGDAIVWEADGDAVYYRGDSEKEVPVTFDISFVLDGQPVSADEIAGKSGKLEMTFNYKNTMSQKVVIDDKETEIYVPFVMVSGMIVDNDVFSHIEVDNGKVIDDGSKSVIVGIALPGINENLGFENSILPDSFTVKADVKNFKLAMTLTVATNDVFNHFGFDGLTDTSDIEGMIETLTGSVKALADGSSKLYEGLKTLGDSVDALIEGIGKLADGAEALKDGAVKLDAGLNAVDGKLAELSDGLNSLSSNSAVLNAGSKKVFETLIAQTQAQLTAAGLASYGIPVPVLTIENYGVELAKLSEILKGAGMPAAAVDGAKASLDEYNAFYTGLNAYTAGVDSAAAGSSAIEGAVNRELLGGSRELADKLGEFAEGVKVINGKMPELTEGIKALTEGAKKLSDGMGELYSEGIEKLLSEIDNVSEFITRMEAVLDVSAAYRSYGGISEDMTGTTKFVYRTEGIN